MLGFWVWFFYGSTLLVCCDLLCLLFLCSCLVAEKVEENKGSQIMTLMGFFNLVCTKTKAILDWPRNFLWGGCVEVQVFMASKIWKFRRIHKCDLIYFFFHWQSSRISRVALIMLFFCSCLVAQKVEESKGSEIMALMVFWFGCIKTRALLDWTWNFWWGRWMESSSFHGFRMMKIPENS